MALLYHARPPEMRGDTLLPLNRLRDVYPDLYARERAKYDGRELLLELRIPILDVLWNDALHLAPIHPALLAAAWRAAGLSSPAWERDFFGIPVDRIASGRAVWFASGVLVDGRIDPADVTAFDAATYRELRDPPPTYHDHLRRNDGRPPRPFAHVPHVLVAAPVDVTGVAVVRAHVEEPA